MSRFQRQNAFLALLLFLVDCSTARCCVVELDENRRSELGWTDAHTVVYGLPIDCNGEDQSRRKILVDDAATFLKDSSNDFLCVQNDLGQTALHLAVRQDRRDVVQLYLDRQLDCLQTPNNGGDTPLHYAVAWNRVHITRALLEHGSGAGTHVINNERETPEMEARRLSHLALISLFESQAHQEDGDYVFEL